MNSFDDLRRRLTLPVIAAPMFLVSGPDLVIAAARAGVIGAFPTVNARSGTELAEWLTRIHAATGPGSAPVAANLIVHHSNSRMREDLAVLLEQPTELVITSVGSPAPVIEPLHRAGALVFADVATVRHAHRAIEAGADGLILLTAGAGGQTGSANPFAFVRTVRSYYDGPIVLAGGITDGVSLRAALELGADLAYLGTRFLATAESMAPDAHKQMIARCDLDDIVQTSALTGLPTNMLAPSLRALGIDPTAAPGSADISALRADSAPVNPWRDLYSAGHATGNIADIPTVPALVDRLHREFDTRRN